MLKTTALFILGAAATSLAAERATYDTAGALTSLISGGSELAVRGEFMVKFTGAPGATAQPADQRSPIARAGAEPRWEGTVPFPNGSQAQVSVAWSESDAGVALDGSVTSKSPFPGRSTFRFPMDVE
jgi:hypothetical protein